MDSKDKLKQWLNRSVRVKITDGRILIGKKLVILIIINILSIIE